MKLSVRAAGLAGGFLWGVSLFLVTLGATYFDFYREPIDFLLVGVYPYYTISLQGAFLGLLWGFVDGFLGGAALAWLYNRMLPASPSNGCCCKAKRQSELI